MRCCLQVLRPGGEADSRVRMSLACKRAAMEGEVWVIWRGERLRLGPVSYSIHDKIAIVVLNGRFRVVRLVDKDGLWICDGPGTGRRIHYKDVRALVVERRSRP